MAVADTSPYGPLVETRLRVMTWNLWWRYGPWQRRHPAIVETLRHVGADVVALQEVWGEPAGADQAAVLGQELGYHHAYEHRHAEDGVTLGNAVLSRWPVVDTEAYPLPALDEPDEHRFVLRVTVDGERGAFQVFCTHLNWRFDHSHVRQAQVRVLADLVAASPPGAFPPVVCGDLNADPQSDEVRMLTGRTTAARVGVVFHDAWEVAGDGGPGNTLSADNPFAAGWLVPPRRFDYILVGWPVTGGRGHVVGCQVVGAEPVDGVHASDHYAVVADLRY